jgi:hypothetical protein
MQLPLGFKGSELQNIVPEFIINNACFYVFLCVQYTQYLRIKCRPSSLKNILIHKISG